MNAETAVIKARGLQALPIDEQWILIEEANGSFRTIDGHKEPDEIFRDKYETAAIKEAGRTA